MLRYVIPAASQKRTRALEEERITKYGDIGVEVADPLKAYVPMPFQHVLFPFGFPVQIKSNDSVVVRLAEQSWGRFEQHFRDSPIEVRFLVSDFLARRRPPPPIYRAQGTLLTLVADAHNFGCCDLANGFGFACVAPGTVAKRDYFRFYFLESMVCMLLDNRHLVAVHAACVAIEDHGVLLVGPSGVGKSSLAYACMRRGWTYISDDGSSLLRRRPGRVVVGNPQSFRFRPSASVLFPELQGHAKLRNGKPTVEITTEQLRAGKTTTQCRIDYVVFLNRQKDEVDPPHLTPVARDESLRRLFQKNVWPTELSTNEERLEAVERLLDAQLLELTYKAFDPAIDLLEQTVRRGKP
ncbi:MAG: hypothetical protein JO033_25340 [Acidobacteriaceae bacterium]|nr:hypothetical protein [Acidobacteriaceae bacterium]MBV9500766.1 hypothetical protein [Acidobacteriaceae bacterium]